MRFKLVYPDNLRARYGTGRGQADAVHRRLLRNRKERIGLHEWIVLHPRKRDLRRTTGLGRHVKRCSRLRSDKDGVVGMVTMTVAYQQGLRPEIDHVPDHERSTAWGDFQAGDESV